MERKIQRAILSVTDKSDLVDFAQKLQEFGVEILSTGGTARMLREGGITVQDVSDFTGFPEMLDGRPTLTAYTCSFLKLDCSPNRGCSITP